VTPIILLIAALQGAFGAALAAAAAHANADPLLPVASNFLMLHGAAGLGLAALARAGAPRALPFAAVALQAGATLFAADLSARVFLGGKLFPMAAPIGGSVAILSWLALAGVAALWLRRDAAT